nr:uncharacterized protein LOC104647164 [Solanum lycopersicum]
MNTKRNTGTRVREVAAGGNQAPHQAPACGVQVPINPAALTDGEVRAAFVQMSLAITAHEYAITAQDTKEDQREAKVEELMNLRQGVISVMEYSLMFFKLSKYASSLVSSRRDEMSRFMTGVSKDMKEDCRAAILHDNMDLARLMVYAHYVKESRRRKRGREGKKPRISYEDSSSTGRGSFVVQDRPKLKKGYQHSGNPTPSRNNNAKGDKSYPKKGNNKNAQCDRKSCCKCGRLHGGECMVGSNDFYGCGNSGHMIRDYPHVKNQANADTEPRFNHTIAADPHNRNMFYALKGREE